MCVFCHSQLNNRIFVLFRAENAIERAGGYRSIISCQRALQEALQGLFHAK